MARLLWQLRKAKGLLSWCRGRALGPALYLRPKLGVRRPGQEGKLTSLGQPRQLTLIQITLCSPPPPPGSLALKRMEFRLWSQRGLGRKEVKRLAQPCPTLQPTHPWVYQDSGQPQSQAHPILMQTPLCPGAPDHMRKMGSSTPSSSSSSSIASTQENHS